MTAPKTRGARKRRPDCKMFQLSAARRRVLFAMSETMSIDELTHVIRVKDGLKISATSVGNWLAAERVINRAQRAADVARQVAAAIKDTDAFGDVDSAIESLAKERAFDALTEGGDASETAALVRLVNEHRKLRIDEQRLKLLEKKAKIADELEAKANSKVALTPEEALRLLREKFGWRQT